MWRTLDQPRLRTIQVPGSAHWAPDAALLYGLLRGANDHLPDGANGHLLGGANGHLPAGANDHLLGGANGRLLAGANGRLLAGANVEKLIYLLMDGDPEIASTLRTETVAAVRAAGGKRIQVNVIDAALGPPFGVSPEPDVQQLTAAISVWVNTAESAPLEALLPPAGPGAGWLGYLVTEAEPLPNTTVTPDPDGRVPGFAQLVPLRVPDGLAMGRVATALARDAHVGRLGHTVDLSLRAECGPAPPHRPCPPLRRHCGGVFPTGGSHRPARVLRRSRR